METFGNWTAPGATPDIDPPVVPDNAASALHVPDVSDLQDSVALVQTVGLSVRDPSRYALMLGNIILGDGSSSRLYRDLRTQTGYVYSVDSGFSWSTSRADFAVSFGSDPQKVGPARALVLREIRDMQQNPVTDAELARAKAQVLRRLPMQRGKRGRYRRAVSLARRSGVADR